MNLGMPNLWMFFIFMPLLGMCVGSFINVVIWRLPFSGQKVSYRGKTGRLSLSWPPSHCPHCNKTVRWHENIPVISWLILRGRCSGCNQRISLRYPLVELGTGIIFLALFIAYYLTGWYGNQFRNMAHGGPTLVLDLVYVSVLLAASGIDADWFIIPLRLPWLVIMAAVVSCAAGVQPMLPSLPAHSAFARAALGGTAGLIAAVIFLRLRLIPRSFSAPPDGKLAENPPPAESLSAPQSADQFVAPPQLRRRPIVPAVIIILAAQAPLWLFASHKIAVLLLLVSGILCFLLGVLPRPADTAESNDLAEEILDESAAPNARHEIFKELLFVLPILILGATAVFIPFPLPASPVFCRLYGTLLGLLAGGGIVWIFRIGGTLVLGRVAMGLGDVHLMAAVGAVLGAPLAIIAFFIAPFAALIWVIILKIMHRPNVLPFGPWLSVAGILALLIGPPVQGWYANQLFPPVHQRPIKTGRVMWPGDNPAADRPHKSP